jgi:glycosyltransferase involved in cell wall biosynthesis
MDVSIIITTYNYANYLEECVWSCLHQKNSSLDFEVIVIDDGSTDHTPDLLSRLDHSRLKKYRIENSGIEKASNTGFQKSSGRYAVRVDADDKLHENYLSVMEEHLTDKFGFYYSDYVVIDGDGTEKEEVKLPPFDADEIRQRGDFLATGTLYRLSLIRSLGGYSEKIRNSGLENYELILKLIREGVQGKHLSEPLFSYKRHSLNISELKRDQIIENGKRLFEQMGTGRFTTNQYHPYNLEL